jgi:hypothetical protein
MNEIDVIIKHWNEGLTATQIGEKIGKTRSAVLGKISRLRASGINLERRAVDKKEKKTKRKDKPLKDERQLSFIDFFTETLVPGPVPDLPSIFDDLPISKSEAGIDLFSLKPFQCHYVIGRIDDTSMYCGEPVHRRSMCKEHHARCYYKPKV